MNWKNIVKTVPAMVAAALALAGCSTSQPGPAPTTPHTVEVTTPAAEASSLAPDAEVAAFSHIVATSPEASDIALMLAGPEKVAAVSASSANPKMGQNPELARKVGKTLESGVKPDAEQILSFTPDLVVMTIRHDSESSVAEQLRAAEVEVLTYDGHEFDTPELYAEAVQKMGDKIGTPKKAAALTDEFMAKIRDIDAKVTKSKKTPSMLALMVRGGKILAMGPKNVVPGLAMRAGATNAGETAGLTRTTPIDAEMLLLANPEILFVEDFMGGGLGPFQELLKNPALAQVPAIKNNRVVLLPMNEASSTAGLQMYKGYATIMAEVQR